MQGIERLREDILILADNCPLSNIQDIHSQLSALSDSSDPNLGTRVASISGPARAQVKELIQSWKKNAPDLPGSALAEILFTTALYAERRRTSQKIELVWTGPGSSEKIHLRPTDQALLDVIELAKEKLLIVAFAIYDVDYILKAIKKALERGVTLSLIAETYQSRTKQYSTSFIERIGPEILESSQVFLWPDHQRPKDSKDNPGCLHVKCATCDDQYLLISSANLTGHALSQNMEMGLLVYGGDLPGRVNAHFQGLIEMGVLEKWG